MALLFPVGGSARAETSYDVCAAPDPGSYLAVGVYLRQRSGFEAQSGSIRVENPGTELQFAAGARWLVGFAHRTTILAEQGVEFDTNGYLHSFYFVGHRLPADGKGLRFSIAPALSASSNVTKDPDEWSSDAVQANLALVWQSSDAGRPGYRFGLCADHRFGGYEVYPVFAYTWHPARNWTAEAGFPEARLDWAAGEHLTVGLRVAPDGNQWYVRNKALTRASDFHYESWSVEVRGRWQLTPAIGVSASAGYSFDQRVDAMLAEAPAQRLEVDNGAWFGAGFRWSFGIRTGGGAIRRIPKVKNSGAETFR